MYNEPQWERCRPGKSKEREKTCKEKPLPGEITLRSYRQCRYRRKESQTVWGCSLQTKNIFIHTHKAYHCSLREEPKRFWQTIKFSGVSVPICIQTQCPRLRNLAVLSCLSYPTSQPAPEHISCHVSDRHQAWLMNVNSLGCRTGSRLSLQISKCCQG